MAKITNLDAILGAPRKVELQGETYLVPYDLPVELYLRVNSVPEDATEKEIIESLYDDLLGLFQVHQPDLESLPVTLTQAVRAIPLIYNDTAEDEPEKPAGNPTRPRGRAAGTRRKTTTRSRSSTS